MNKKKIIFQSFRIFLAILSAFLFVFFKEEILNVFPFLSNEYFLVFIVVFSLYVTLIFWFDANKNHIMRNQFVDIVTHKFRTPLTAIKWSADTLETGIDFDARKVEVEKIRISLKKLGEIVDTLMGIIESEETVFYHFNPVNFRTIIESVLGEALKKEAEEKGVTFSLNFPSKMPIIYADNKRMEFVVKNLIENAITYTPRGGQIMLGMEAKDNSMIFSVKDTGIGIDSGDLPSLFTGFYRSKEAKLSDTEGMGLGLYVSEKIIKKHKGRIWATSEGKGKGSQFFIEFKIDKYGQVVS